MNKKCVLASLLVVLALIMGVNSFAYASSNQVIYNSIPLLLPPNFPSQGFECCSVKQIGDYIVLTGSEQPLSAVTILLSDWAKHTQYPSFGTATGWSPFPVTLTLYNVLHGPLRVGSVIVSTTQSFSIPWRPEQTPFCLGKSDDGYDVGTGICYHGIAFPVTFDFSGLSIVLPNEVIFGIAYNTQTMGYHPLGVVGPYNSLNVVLMDETTYPTTIGTDGTGPDGMFRDAPIVNAGSQDIGYNSLGTLNVFRLDTGWATSGDSNLAIRFTVLSAFSTGGCDANVHSSHARVGHEYLC